MKQPDQGAVASIEAKVSENMTAATFAANEGEAFPEVLATPFLVGDLERACAKLLEPLLDDGELSVGAVIEVHIIRQIMHANPLYGGAFSVTL